MLQNIYTHVNKLKLFRFQKIPHGMKEHYSECYGHNNGFLHAFLLLNCL